LEGCVAALLAAKNNKKVVLFEQSGALGGMATQGLCSFLSGIYSDDKTLQEIVIQLFGDVPASGLLYDEQKLKVVLAQTLGEAGVTILFHVFFDSLIISENKKRVKGCLMNGKTGSFKVYGTTLIDATDTHVTASNALDSSQMISVGMKLNGVDIPSLKASIGSVQSCQGGYVGEIAPSVLVLASTDFNQVVLLDAVKAQPSSDGVLGVSQVQLNVRNACLAMLEELKGRYQAFSQARIINVAPRMNLYRCSKDRKPASIFLNLIVCNDGFGEYTNESAIRHAAKAVEYGVS
jgi:hypothetical protein